MGIFLDMTYFSGLHFKYNPLHTHLNVDHVQWTMCLVQGHSNSEGGVGDTSYHRGGGEGPGGGEDLSSTAVEYTI